MEEILSLFASYLPIHQFFFPVYLYIIVWLHRCSAAHALNVKRQELKMEESRKTVLVCLKLS